MPFELPRVYFETVFTIGETEFVLPKVFAVVTACNPMDRICSQAQNQLADLELRKRLENQKLEPLRITGCSPDGSHAEPGWGFSAPLDFALEIAREFHQRALWWIENGELHLVDCANPEPIPIGLFSERILSS